MERTVIKTMSRFISKKDIRVAIVVILLSQSEKEGLSFMASHYPVPDMHRAGPGFQGTETLQADFGHTYV
ncbi:hypothetical protein CR205_04295 [Alteribacter lacisalsi]|uniref:Uncharacterized protein n=1 Tax=Alteribacter lacisalsi TaxID=2045244 RepID=A0A2W0HL52_9BACI|nr:hypothetical protein CR205_04295 [Alteribacter lacisalsi]